MKQHFYSLIIPCHNEEETILKVLDISKKYVDEIIVINDASSNGTRELLERRNDIRLINNKQRLGQEKSIENGIKIANGDIIITMDADLEHNPYDIPRFKKHLLEKELDFVMGRRTKIPREGEKQLSKIFEERFNITDVLNGFRIFRRQIYYDLGFHYKNDFYGLSFLMEALKKWKVGQIKITEMKQRKTPRIGSNKEIEKKLQDIIKYVLREMENEKS